VRSEHRLHYSEKLNKCFYLEVTTIISNGNSSLQLRLFDHNENKEYGSYYATNGGTPGYVGCIVKEALCTSEKEWRQLAKPYLED
jgi:hypothetical protein